MLVRMSQDVSATSGDAPAPEPPEVVEWGDDAPDDGRVARLLTGLRANRRALPIVAGVGAVAAAGSVLSEWRVVTLEGTNSVVDRTPGSVLSFPTVGTVYLLGLVVVGAALALTLFGLGSVRHHARLVGLVTTAVLGLMLIATGANLEQLGGTFDDVVIGFPGPVDSATVSFGRGLFMAFAAVAALAFALWLAAPTGHRIAWRAAQPQAPTGSDVEYVDDVDPADGELGPDWPWQRRHHSVRADDLQRPSPLDLTVEAATPFTSPPDDRDTR